MILVFSSMFLNAQIFSKSESGHKIIYKYCQIVYICLIFRNDFENKNKKKEKGFHGKSKESI